MRHRVLLLLQDGGVHRHPLRIHSGAHGSPVRRGAAAGHVAAPADDQVQRGALHRAEGRGGGVHPGRPGAGAGGYRLLPRERAGHHRGAAGIGVLVHRRGEFALRVAEMPGGHGLVGVFRRAAGEGQRGGNARRGVRPQRGRLLPADRVRQPGEHPGSSAPAPGDIRALSSAIYAGPGKKHGFVSVDAKCGPQFMGRKWFFRGALQNLVFCNAPC